MNIEQIKAIIGGTEETLRLLQSLPKYQAIESSEGFSTPNDLVLADAIQTLSEIYQAIVDTEYYLADSKPEPVPENPSNLFDLLGT